MKYYVIAGEASGDLHGSNLLKELFKLDPGATVRFWGGVLMAEVAGNPPVKHYRELAFMGFVEVVQNLPTILRNLEFCKADIRAFSPDVVVFIDYPGFNLRMAKFAKRAGYKTVYYISPQLWAWNANRIKSIQKYIDQMLVILPFEEKYYADRGVAAFFTGHPLLDALSMVREQQPELALAQENKPIIALLPGSRKQEIGVMLPVMLSVVPHFPEYQFVLAGAPSLEKSFYEQFDISVVEVVYNQTYALLSRATAALVTSGTATLETALHRVPEVVCYRGSEISYQIARRLVKHIKFISLVNLIMDREVVPELIQGDFTQENVRKHLAAILPGGAARSAQLENFDQLITKLGNGGASRRAAEKIISVASAENI